MQPKIKKIYSENNDFQHLEVIKKNREKRNQYKEFFFEGVKSIERAIQFKWDIIAYGYSSERKLSDWAKNILSNSTAKIHYDLPLSLMDKLSDKEECSELIAIAAIPSNNLSRINTHENMLVAVFDRPSSYGNLGTIIRSCDSFNVDGLIITGHGVDLFDPQTIRSTMGSFFTLPVVKLESHVELYQWFSEIKKSYIDLQLIGTSAKADTIITDQDLIKPTILIVGNETDGLSRNYKTLCDKLVKIPIYGSATSLNVACATSIMLYEVDRQRRQVFTGGKK